MIKNLALGFIKPHAGKSLPVWDSVRSMLDRQGIRVSSEFAVTGPEIRQKGLIDRHYAAIAKVGACADVCGLSVSESTEAAFQQAFGLAWRSAVAEGKILSGVTATSVLNLSATELMWIWLKVKPAKLGPGFYAAEISGRYVLNGFYPSIREIYTVDSAAIRVFLMEFDGAVLPWKRFRAEIIGSTDPAKAPPTSIRGSLYRVRDDMALTMDARDNVIHASASPFEAFNERTIWMPGFDVNSDPLAMELAGTGITPGVLGRLAAENPVVTLKGKTASLVDQLEDTDTNETAALVRTIKQG